MKEWINKNSTGLFSKKLEVGPHRYSNVENVTDHESFYLDNKYIGDIYWDHGYWNKESQSHETPSDKCQWYSKEEGFIPKKTIRGYGNIIKYLRIKAENQ